MESLAGLPGAEVVVAGLRDLEAGTPSIEALLVSIGAPRLRRQGVAIDRVEPDAEHQPAALRETFEAIVPLLYRYPAIDPASFRTSVDDLLRSLT